MTVKMLTHMQMWCTLGGVGTFAKEKVLELIWINLEERERFSVCSELCGDSWIGILY